MCGSKQGISKMRNSKYGNVTEFITVIVPLLTVVSNSLWPHELHHTRLSCPSLSPGVCSNSCPLSWWCYPTISSSVAPFSSCPQPFPASGSFPMSWLFTSDGQSNGAWASASVLPTDIVALWCNHSLRDGERRKNTKPWQKTFKSKERKFPRLAGYSNQHLLIGMSPV